MGGSTKKKVSGVRARVRLPGSSCSQRHHKTTLPPPDEVRPGRCAGPGYRRVRVTRQKTPQDSGSGRTTKPQPSLMQHLRRNSNMCPSLRALRCALPKQLSSLTRSKALHPLGPSPRCGFLNEPEPLAQAPAPAPARAPRFTYAPKGNASLTVRSICSQNRPKELSQRSKILLARIR